MTEFCRLTKAKTFVRTKTFVWQLVFWILCQTWRCSVRNLSRFIGKSVIYYTYVFVQVKSLWNKSGLVFLPFEWIFWIYISRGLVHKTSPSYTTMSVRQPCLVRCPSWERVSYLWMGTLSSSNELNVLNKCSFAVREMQLLHFTDCNT